MSFRWFTSLTLLSLLLIMAAGCSDLSKDKVVEKPIDSSRWSESCELKVDEFADIMERNIPEQINCLQRNIELFMEVVESERRGFLSRVAFERYVVRNLPDFKPENVKAIKSVFDIAHLIFGDDRNFLSPSSVKKIFDFLYLFNREAPRVYPLFISRDEGTPYQVHKLDRMRIYSAFNTISAALLDIYKRDRGSQVHSVNIVNILESFTNSTTEEVLEKIRAVLFVKRVVLGGRKEEMTHQELGDLLRKMGQAGQLAFDIMRVKKINFKLNETDPNGQRSLFEFLKDDLDILEGLLFFSAESSERLFTVDELIDAIPYFTTEEDNWPDFKNYRVEALQAKMLLATNQPWRRNEDLRGKEWFLPGEIRMIIDHGKELINRGLIYYDIFDFFRLRLQTPGPVSINYNNYLLQFPTHGRYVEQFSRIVKDYQFFAGTFDLPYYTYDYRRNVEGIIEVGLMEYAFQLASRRFGSPIEEAGGFGLNLEQIQQLVTVFKKPLVDEELLMPGRELKLTENITLLMTLFQSMSDGDAYINVAEGAAFFGQVFATMNHAEWFEVEMGKRCPTDDRGRITDINCHRQNYFGLVCERFKDQFPELLKEIGITDCSEKGDERFIQNYLSTVESIARTCTVFKDGSPVPVDRRDYMPIMVMLQTIEGAVMRFDVNRNNLLDPNEVKMGYRTVFREAIEALVEEQAGVIARLPFNLGANISRKIYYYLIKYKAVPSKISEFMKLLNIEATTARRDTFAAVLKIISDQGEPSTFDCETLR